MEATDALAQSKSPAALEQFRNQTFFILIILFWLIISTIRASIGRELCYILSCSKLLKIYTLHMV